MQNINGNYSIKFLVKFHFFAQIFQKACVISRKNQIASDLIDILYVGWKHQYDNYIGYQLNLMQSNTLREMTQINSYTNKILLKILCYNGNSKIKYNSWYNKKNPNCTKMKYTMFSSLKWINNNFNASANLDVYVLYAIYFIYIQFGFFLYCTMNIFDF